MYISLSVKGKRAYLKRSDDALGSLCQAENDNNAFCTDPTIELPATETTTPWPIHFFYTTGLRASDTKRIKSIVQYILRDRARKRI